MGNMGRKVERQVGAAVAAAAAAGKVRERDSAMRRGGRGG